MSVPDTTTAKALHQRMRERIAALPPLVSDPDDLHLVPMDVERLDQREAWEAHEERAEKLERWLERGER